MVWEYENRPSCHLGCGVSTEHQCLLKHLQPPVKLVLLNEDKDWLSAWHCSYSLSYLSYCPLDLWGHPGISQCATLFFWLHPLWLFPFPSLPFPSFPLLSATPLITQQPTRQSHPSALLVEWAVALREVRCFSVPQFPPCKTRAILTASVKHIKVSGERTLSTPASPPTPLESFGLSRSPSRLSSLPRNGFALWQAAVLLSQLTWLLKSSPERRYWSNTGCFVWVQYSAFSIICQGSLVVWKFVGLST